MTKNQIEFNKLKETIRTNRANEALIEARDTATRRLGLDSLRETQRHNAQVELQARDNLAEQYRNNVAQLAELQRAHLTSEGLATSRLALDLDALAETKRSHQQAEQISIDRNKLSQLELDEVKRHNQANEDLGLISSNTSRYAAEVGAASHVNAAGINAAASQYASDNALLARQLEIDANRYGIDTSASLRAQELGETKRANLARETETARSNVARETNTAASISEQTRHNRVSEAQTSRSISNDLNMRQQQNAIARANAVTNRMKADVDLALQPSRQFAAYSGGISGLLQAGSNLVSSIKKGR